MTGNADSCSPRRTVKILPILVFLSTLTLGACGDAAGPSATTITFRVDEITCSGGATVEITIDDVIQGSYHFDAGAQRTFPVSAGFHSVRAQGEEPGDGFVNLEREVTVPEGEDFTVVLSCTD